MKLIQSLAARTFVGKIFEAIGSHPEEAGIIADHLVESNLVGHESHGLIRVKKYVDWCRNGDVHPNRHAEIASDHGMAFLIDGQFGYGQVIGLEAMDLLRSRVREKGFAAVLIRNSGHLGRIGAWPEYLAKSGLVSVHFVNTSGYGILVAPHGGSDRRLSANPIAAGAPNESGAPLVLDIATAAIAEGKIQVMRNRGERLPNAAVIDGKGQPTTDPEAFYSDPPGAIFPFGGHKGSGLSFFCELMAGSLSGGYASNPDSPTASRLVNNMTSIAFDPAAFGGVDFFRQDVAAFVAWIKGSPPLNEGGEVLLPGEIEARRRSERLRNGLPIDTATYAQLAITAQSVGVEVGDYIEELQ